MENYQEINSVTIDRWVEEGWEWGKPITHEQFLKAKAGEWEIVLTPTKAVPKAWLGNVTGKKILGLACGGGQQMPILTAAGAECTVLDYSAKQIETERTVAEREGYRIDAIRADMTKTLPFADGTFDIIVHPVSDCYVKDVAHVYRECFRVLKKGGILIAGFDTEINYLVDKDEKQIVNRMPFDPLENEDQRRHLEDADCGIQFSHTVGELIGAQLSAGFTLTDLYDDTNGEGYLHEMNISTFLATRAVK